MGKRTHGPYLIAAIEYSDIEKVSHILTTKFRDKSKVKTFLTSEVRRLASEYTEVPLLLSATLNDPTIARYFITKHDANVNFVYEYGAPSQRRRKTALLVAVRRGNYATVDALLSLNADANCSDHKSRTALHHAVRRADYRMAKLLLARGALASPCDAAGNTALHVASIFGHSEMCRLLLRHSADLYKKGQHGALPIHMAAREGHAALVKMFVTLYEVNADIRVPCYNGDREQAPIHVAASQGHHETVFTLLEQCAADVNSQDSEGETPLHCSVVNEYDPLGMKSKDDYTETVKILLNFGAEVNVQNARGETALHLAARNEFQKVVEVLVLAGSDPMTEDNDKNKPINLVAEEDAVSRQTLKNAMVDRDRLFNESREIRSKGFSTSLQRELPLSIRSQSTMNVPLLAGMHGTVAANRYTSHTGLFQPNLSMQYAPTYGGGGLSGGPMNMSLGYIPGAVGMAHYAAPGVGSGGGGNQSGSRTGSSSNGSWNHQPRLPESMMHGAVSAVALADHPPRGPMAALRKVRSVEELDQPRVKNDAASKAAASRRRRVRKSSYQESETSSFWAVTPPGSAHDDHDGEEGDDRSILDVTIPPLKGGKHQQTAVLSKTKKTTKHKDRLNENDEERVQPTDVRQKQPLQPKQPLQFMSAKKAAAMKAERDSDESDDYFLDDDSSVDMLDEDDDRPKKKKDKGTKTGTIQQQQQQPVPSARQTVMKGEPAVKKKAVESWVDEQARILKERNSAPEAEKPVAHSTPPASKKDKKHGDDEKKKKKKKKKREKSESESDEDSESETSSSSETETTESDSDISSNAPKGPPPPPPVTKPKPQTLPKPPSSKDGSSGKTGPAQTQRKISGGTTRQHPLFQMEQVGCDRIVQLDVDDSTETGETIISIIPLQPPGPTRVQKIPAGVETSTYLSLSRDSRPATPKVADDSSSSKSKSKKSSTPTPPDGKISKHKGDDDGRKVGAVEAPRPVPRPRETKMTSSSNVVAQSGGGGDRKTSDSSQKKSKRNSRKKSAASDSGSASSTDFSDEDHEEAAALAAAVAASKSKSSARSTPVPTKQQPVVGERSAKQPVAKPATQPPSQRSGNVSAARLIFEKAGTDLTPDASISFGDVSTSSTAGVAHGPPTGGKATTGANSQLPKTSTGATTTMEKPIAPAKQKQVPPQKPVSAQRKAQQTQNGGHGDTSSSGSGSGSDSSDDGSDEDDGGTRRSDDLRTVTYRSETQSVGFTLVGGNVKGVFVDGVDATSDPARAGLRVGDQLLCVDGRPVFGRTREDVMQLVRTSIGGSTTVLLVRHRPNLCRAVADADSGAGDLFVVRSHFVYDASRRGELTVRDGDVFAVSDTLPDGSAGFWRARKIDFAGRKDGDSSAIGGGGTSVEGLIPNRSKADQIVMRDLLAQGKSASQSQRGAAFFRSFRRSKSVGRNGAPDDDDSVGGDRRNSMSGLSDIVSYERVVQKVAEVRRPVVVLGLFCDTVRGMLISDASQKFVAPFGEVETQSKNASSGSSELSVDVRPIAAVPPNEHCVLILSPPGIEYLQQRTDLNPIVVYISPVSKTVVKVVKSKLAPTYNKNPGFMYDEAARFEKNYAHLFSVVVPYTMDDAWYHNLRDAVDYLQNQPTWVSIPPADLEADAEAEAAKVLPPRVLKAAAETVASRQGTGTGTGKTTGKASGTRPISRTTDDLPNEYRSQQNAGGGAGATGSTGGVVRKTDNLVSPKSVDVGLNGHSKEVDGATGSTGRTLKTVPVSDISKGRTEHAAASDKDKPTTKTSVPAKARNQSTSSTLDRQPQQQQPQSMPPVAPVPGIGGVIARPRMIAVSQSHETQL